MVRSSDQKLIIEISSGAFLISAVLILMLPLQWVVAVMFAALVHEFCHASCTVLLGGRIESLRIGCKGAVMEGTGLSTSREMIASLAGPLGSLSLLLLSKWMPRASICGFVHGIYNLLPLFPLDGGRILRNFLHLFLSPPLANKVFVYTQRFFLIIVVVILCIGIGKISFLLLAILILGFLWRRRQITLAKRPFWRYNRDTIEKEVRL